MVYFTFFPNLYKKQVLSNIWMTDRLEILQNYINTKPWQFTIPVMTNKQPILTGFVQSDEILFLNGVQNNNQRLLRKTIDDDNIN